MTTYTDNLYIIDEEGNETTLEILKYFSKNIQYINAISKRFIRPYRLTPKMLLEDTYKDKLKERGVSRLPSLVCFYPRHEVFTGVQEIIQFYDTLLEIMQSISNDKKISQEHDESLLSGDNDMLHNFYKGEVNL